MSGTHTKKVRLTTHSLFVGEVGVSTAGIIFILIISAILFVTDDRWWAGLVVLGFIPLAMLYGWAFRLLGITPQPAMVPIDSSNATLQAEVARHNQLVQDMQYRLDAAGGVPGDISLRARLDYVIKQRDGIVE